MVVFVVIKVIFVYVDVFFVAFCHSLQCQKKQISFHDLQKCHKVFRIGEEKMFWGKRNRELFF